MPKARRVRVRQAVTMAGIAALFVVTVLVVTASAVVLCARPRLDGTFNATVKIRELCKPREQQLDPVALGLQGPPGQQGDPGPQGDPGVCSCSSTTTPTTSSTSSSGFVTSTTCSTVTTGTLWCFNKPGCTGNCPSGMTCGDMGGGSCACVGTPPPCGDISYFPGGQFCHYGACPVGTTCQVVPSACSGTCACL